MIRLDQKRWKDMKRTSRKASELAIHCFIFPCPVMRMAFCLASSVTMAESEVVEVAWATVDIEKEMMEKVEVRI